LLYELQGHDAFKCAHLPALRELTAGEKALLGNMLVRRLNTPLTSSAGRLFDAIAALIGLRQRTRFEGQAAMDLEFAVEGSQTDEAYPFTVTTSGEIATLDWGPLIMGVLQDLEAGVGAGSIAAKFHNALAEMIISIARQAGEERVVLSGGCFQNRYLTEQTVRRLRQEGFRAYWHQRVPPNDGGIALGQISAAFREQRKAALCV
jgi:hydrogenase maturation protein HypF